MRCTRGVVCAASTRPDACVGGRCGYLIAVAHEASVTVTLSELRQVPPPGYSTQRRYPGLPPVPHAPPELSGGVSHLSSRSLYPRWRCDAPPMEAAQALSLSLRLLRMAL
jgi:hypothetical protein